MLTKINGLQVYLNEFIDLGVEKAMRHHKFNNDEIGCIFYKVGSGSSLFYAEKLDPNPNLVQNQTGSATLPAGVLDVAHSDEEPQRYLIIPWQIRNHIQ